MLAGIVGDGPVAVVRSSLPSRPPTDGLTGLTSYLAESDTKEKRYADREALSCFLSPLMYPQTGVLPGAVSQSGDSDVISGYCGH